MIKKTSKDILILSFLLVFLTIVLISYYKLSNEKKIQIITDKNKYSTGELLKVKIKNQSNKEICFSSCYPYYFERKEKGWKAYSYDACLHKDKAVYCLKPNLVKAFQLSIPKKVIKKGVVHRLAIPICVTCKPNNNFKQEEWFYSNKFIIN